MAGDMANGNGTFDPIASYARLSERVEGQGKDLVDIRSNMNTGFQQVNSNIGSLATETRAAIATITNELRGNSRTQWPVIWSAIGVSFAVLAAVGALAYRPVLNTQDRLDAAVARFAETTVTQKELDWRQARSLEDRQRTEGAIRDIRDGLVPRAEHERVWANYDQRFADQQRQVDELKQAQGSVYGARDALLDIRERIDRLERLRTSMASPG